MLARTADNLFWLARQMERADFTARMIEATLRLEYLPRSGVEDPSVEWEGALNAVGAYEAYIAGRERIDEASAIDFLTFERGNPSSICSGRSWLPPCPSSAAPAADAALGAHFGFSALMPAVSPLSSRCIP